MLLGLVLSFAPSIPGTRLHACPWLLGTVATQDTLAKLVRVSLSQAQQLMMLQYPQSNGSILWKQTAGEGPSTCTGISQLPPWEQLFLQKSYQKQQDFSHMDLCFLFFWCSWCTKFTLSLNLKGKYDLEEPAHLSFPCMFPPPG